MSEIEVDGKSLGQLAFEAYCEAVGGETFDGKPIPGWDELHGDRLKVQGGWHAAAAEVARWVRAGGILDEALANPARTRRGWRPVRLPIEVDEESAAEHGLLPPQVDAGRAAEARRSVPVSAAGVGADGEPEADEADRTGDEAKA